MTTPLIFERMHAVLAALPAIGKEQENVQQGFKFRGIDDVMNALNPLLTKHGVFYVPEVLERVAATRATRNGGVMYEVNLHVRFTFYAPDGSSVTASGWGEGTDSGDKSTSKAMTGAMKYVLFEVFAISTKEASDLDLDRTTPEDSQPVNAAAETAAQLVLARYMKLPDDLRTKVDDWLTKAGGDLATAIYDEPFERMVAKGEAVAAERSDPQRPFEETSA